MINNIEIQIEEQRDLSSIDEIIFRLKIKKINVDKVLSRTELTKRITEYIKSGTDTIREG